MQAAWDNLKQEKAEEKTGQEGSVTGEGKRGRGKTK